MKFEGSHTAQLLARWIEYITAEFFHLELPRDVFVAITSDGAKNCVNAVADELRFFCHQCDAHLLKTMVDWAIGTGSTVYKFENGNLISTGT